MVVNDNVMDSDPKEISAKLIDSLNSICRISQFLKKMDKNRSILNISTSIISHVLLLFVAIFVRRLLIQYIGNSENGLRCLYMSIIGMLGVAELGIGGTIIFPMYKPMLAGEKKQVAALYHLYRKLYRIIGAVIFGCFLQKGLAR